MKTDSMVYMIHNKYKKELLNDTDTTKVYLNTTSSYDIYVETYIDFIFKKIESMILVVAGASALSGMAFCKGQTLIGVIVIIGAGLIAGFNIDSAIDQAKTSESLSELYEGCTYQCMGEVKKKITSSLNK